MLPPFLCLQKKRENCGAFLFMSTEKAGELRRIPLHPCFLASEGRPPFVDKRRVLPLASPPRQKTFSRACPLSAIAL